MSVSFGQVLRRPIFSIGQYGRTYFGRRGWWKWKPERQRCKKAPESWRKMMRMNNKSSEAVYKRYQNLWHDYDCRKQRKDEFNDVVLSVFFNSIKTNMQQASFGCLWVIYSCINSYMIDQYGCNLGSLVRLTSHLKMETSHHISKKSQTFSAE